MYKSKDAFSSENIVTKASNACSWETSGTTVSILFPEELYVQEQGRFFLRKYSYKSQNACSWETLGTKVRHDAGDKK